MAVARKRLHCKCNCHTSWWVTDFRYSRHVDCNECVRALRQERGHLRSLERQFREAVRALPDAVTLVRTALQNFREVVNVEATRQGPGIANVKVVVEMRQLNKFLERHLETLQRLVKSRFGVGLIVVEAVEGKLHWDPNFEKTPGVGGRVPTVLGTPDAGGE